MALRRDITQLPRLVAALPEGERARAERLFEISATAGRLVPPEAMRTWIEHSFGSVEAVREQAIVRVTNRVTLEGTLFNGLRASRPHDTGVSMDLEKEIEATAGDPFCDPQKGTPADVFGRIRGKHSLTAANIAKYDGYHAVIVFDDHNPLRLNPEKVADYISVGMAWSRRVFETDPAFRYPFLMWNCLWRAGGSIIHGHAQITATKGSHYPRIERLRRASGAYRAEHGSNYFDDLYRAHEALGLAVPASGATRAFASLTPVKERELVVIGPGPGDESLKQTVGALLRSYVSRLGASSFNVAFYMPPLARAEEDWTGFPAIVHIVDRGSPANRTSDVGAMELYAASVVASDPFGVAAALRDGPPH